MKSMARLDMAQDSHAIKFPGSRLLPPPAAPFKTIRHAFAKVD